MDLHGLEPCALGFKGWLPLQPLGVGLETVPARVVGRVGLEPTTKGL